MILIYRLDGEREAHVDLPIGLTSDTAQRGAEVWRFVPVLQCRVNRFVTIAIGPIYYAPPLNSMAKGITGYISRINRSVLSAAWKHRMRVSERHNSPAATASRSARRIQNESDFQVTASEKNAITKNKLTFLVRRALAFSGNCVQTAGQKRLTGTDHPGGFLTRATTQREGGFELSTYARGVLCSIEPNDSGLGGYET